MEDKLVRIGINKDGILVMAGDPNYRGAYKEYMKLIRNGGEVKNVPLSKFKTMKLYEKYIVEEAKDNAKEEAGRVKTAADAEIEQEISRAKEYLRQQVASIAIAGAEKVLKREIDVKAHSAIVDDMIAQI